MLHMTARHWLITLFLVLASPPADIGLHVDGIGPEWDTEYDDTGE